MPEFAVHNAEVLLCSAVKITFG